MKRAVLMSVLALSCATSAEVRDGPEIGGGPDPCAADRPRQVRDSAAAVTADTSQAPQVVVYTVKPRLLNLAEVKRAIEEKYPRHLREAGIGGTTVVHVLVSEEGCVRDQVVKRSSSSAALDTAALEVATVARFSPGMNRGKAVELWIEIEINFRAR